MKADELRYRGALEEILRRASNPQLEATRTAVMEIAAKALQVPVPKRTW